MLSTEAYLENRNTADFLIKCSAIIKRVYRPNLIRAKNEDKNVHSD